MSLVALRFMAQSNQSVPFISVIVPTYNRERTIVRCVENILEQDYENFEILIVDDGSTDSTLEVLSPFADRIRLIKKKNGGVGSARNLGAREAKGEWLAFQDSDDLWERDKLSYQVYLIGKYTCVNAVVCNLQIYREHFGREVNWFEEIGLSGVGENVSDDPFLLHLEKRLAWLQGSLIRRQTALQCGLSDENLKIFVDLDFILKLAKFGSWVYSDRVVARVCRDFDDDESISSRRKKDPEVGFRAMDIVLSRQLVQCLDKRHEVVLRTLLCGNWNKAGNYANSRWSMRASFSCYLKAFYYRKRPVILVKGLLFWIPFSRWFDRS